MNLKYIYILIVGLFISGVALGENERTISLEKESSTSLRIKVKLDNLVINKVNNEGYSFTEISIPQTYSTGEIGGPELPIVNQLIEVPKGATIKVDANINKVYNVSLKDKDASTIVYPLQASASKTKGSKSSFTYKPELYEKYVSTRSFQQPKVEVLGTMRGKTIALLSYSPVSYDAATGNIKQVVESEINISFDRPIESYDRGLASPYFDPIFSRLLNNRNLEDPNTLWKNPVKYLILSSKKYEEALKPFIQWKTEKGFNVITEYVDNIGNTEENIKAWVKSQFDNVTEASPAPSFLLIAGDVEDVICERGAQTNAVTDLYYASIDGDMFPELFYGRMSASNAAEMTAQVNKTIKYEQYKLDKPDYLNNVELIAGIDEENNWHSKVGKPFIQYALNNYYNNSKYKNVYNYYENYDGFKDNINKGVGYLHYTGHGLNTEWIIPKYKVEDAKSIQNVGMPAFVTANCCLSADFGYSESLGEAFLRADNKGAIGYIGSAPTSYWLEDFYWEVGAFKIVGQNDGYVPTAGETTTGGIDALLTKDDICGNAVMFYGNIAVTEAHTQGFPTNKSAHYYWEAYNYLGDPSVFTYNNTPSPLVASCQQIVVGASKVKITGDPGTYVALSQNGNLLGSGKISAVGEIELPIIPLEEEGKVKFVASARNKITIISEVDAISVTDAFCQLDSYKIYDTDNNLTSSLEAGKEYYLELYIINNGNSAGNDINITAEKLDDIISVVESTSKVDAINPDETVKATSKIKIAVAAKVKNLSSARLKIKMTSGDNNWENTINQKIHAPELQVSYKFLSKGIPQSGQKRKVKFTVENIGSSIANNIKASISANQNLNATITEKSQNIEALEVGETVELTYDVEIGNVEGYKKSHTELSTEGDNLVESKVRFLFSINVFEDFESGDLSYNDWYFSDNEKPWVIAVNDGYSGSKYSIKSPAIDNNESTAVSTYVRVNEPGKIEFSFKKESEDVYDVLEFYIDDELINTFTEIYDWEKASFDIGAGVHELKWVYKKDESGTLWGDAVWIDFIKIDHSEIMSDKDAPKIVRILGNSNEISKPLDIILDIEDLSNIKTVVGTYKIGNDVQDITFNDIGRRSIPGSKTATYIASIPANATPTQGSIRFNITDELDNTCESKVYPLTWGKMKNVTDNFETNDFTTLNWSFSGDQDWKIETIDGQLSATSGEISHNQTSVLKLEEKFITIGSLSFDFLTSCEVDYDKLTFKVDGKEIDKWSGVYDWRSHTYNNIQPGTHTFEWIYSKDNANSSAKDNVQIDNVVVNGLDDNNLFAANNAPKFKSTPTTAIPVREKYEYTIEFSDDENDLLHLDMERLPYWLTAEVISDNRIKLAGTPMRGGEYPVSLSLTDGLNETKQEFVLTVSYPEGVCDEIEYGVTIYPNPTKSIISFGKICYSASIYTIDGRKVKHNQNAASISLEDMEKGIYILKLEVEQNTHIIRKVIKN
ncbi:MAG: C25 family cysteine peptidase [Hyphomicrobiales bacterium]